MTSVYDSATSRSKATAPVQLSTVYSESLDNLLPSAEALNAGKQMCLRTWGMRVVNCRPLHGGMLHATALPPAA